MTATLTVVDQTLAGTTADTFTLEFPTEKITVRELIRERVYQEVQDFNILRRSRKHPLVTPTDFERRLNDASKHSKRTIDWKKQFEIAVEAFTGGRVLVLVGDRQVDSLDDEIVIGRDTSVGFVRLTPLVGG